MSLYPSLEDMQVSKMMQAQQNAAASATAPSAPQITADGGSVLYPTLTEYMGLELTPSMMAELMPVPQQNEVALNPYAPISGNSLAVHSTLIKPGIRELILCKGVDKKVGVRVKEVNKGIFVCLVVKNSPAAMAGLRFGDQIVQVNGTDVAGYTDDKFHRLLDKSPINNISVIIRDRPFERTITLQKDSKGHVGFHFNNQKITQIVLNSSASRNGLLIDHHILEVNGQNMVGLKDKEITKAIDSAPTTVTLTIIPSVIFDHIMKNLSRSFIREKMDHSTWDF